MTAEIDRRTALAVTLTAGAMLAAQGCAIAQQATATTTGYQPRPLPFDPKTIPGLSERILVSHHANNYVGAVTRLGAIEAQVAQLDPTAPGFMFNGLKREELLAMNSMILHELYFASLGRGGAKPGAQLATQIEKDFGSQQKWRDQFVAIGKANSSTSGRRITPWRSPMAAASSPWTCMSTPITWISARRPQLTSTPTWAPSTGKVRIERSAGSGLRDTRRPSYASRPHRSFIQGRLPRLWRASRSDRAYAPGLCRREEVD
jgi:Fe-Mn family superoxide dismutase